MMSESYDIQIHTIISGEQRTSASLGRERIVGLLTFLVAIAWLYTTLNPVWSWIERRAFIGEIVMMTGEMKGDDAAAGAQGLAVLGNLMQPRANGAVTGKERGDEPSAPAARQRIHGSLAGAAFGWLGVTTVVGLWLAMAGVAGLTSGAGPRRAGAYLLPVGALALGVLVWYVWKRYEWYESILPGWVRPAVFALLILLAASMGALANRHGVGVQRVGGYLVVFSAVFSVAAIWAALRWGEMPTGQVGAGLYLKVFAIQSTYGWFLLLATIGLR